MIETQHSAIGLRHGTLVHVPYRERWPELFQAEREMLREAIPSPEAEIEHIGSTSVPGLMAKPIIDIAVAVPEADHDDTAGSLEDLGYVDRGHRSGRLFVRLRDEDVRTHNLHLYHPDDPAMRDQIVFRDVLRRDPKVAHAYAALKYGIAQRASRTEYAEEKALFIRRILLEASLH